MPREWINKLQAQTYLTDALRQLVDIAGEDREKVETWPKHLQPTDMDLLKMGKY